MGQFCTGVTVITTLTADDQPAGFACQSFAALSLDPPLVLFCPQKTSRTWSVIEQRGAFCVNVLSNRQQDVSANFGAPREDKFSGVVWDPSPAGLPVIRHCLTWAECTIDQSPTVVITTSSSAAHRRWEKCCRTSRCCSTAADTSPPSTRA